MSGDGVSSVVAAAPALNAALAASVGTAGVVRVSARLMPMSSTLAIPAGAGVSYEGQGSVLDFRTLVGSEVAPVNAIVLTSPSAAFPISGIDTDSGNFWQWRGAIHSLSAVGPGSASYVDGVVADGASNPATRASRAIVYGGCIYGFRKGLALRNYSYLEKFSDMNIMACDTCVSAEGGLDQGENTVLDHPVLQTSNVGIAVDSGTDNVELIMREPSIDYNKQALVWKSGYGIVTLRTPHIETRAAIANDPTQYHLDLSAGASSPSLLWMDGGFHVCAGGPLPVWPAYMHIGNNITVRITGSPRMHTLAGPGYVWAAGKGPAGADVMMSAMAKLSGNGRLVIQDPITTFSTPNLPSITAPGASNSLLADPGFEQTTVVDNWYDGSTTPGSSIGTIATSTDAFLTGARCLKVPLVGGSGVNRRLKCNIPITKLIGGGGKRFRFGFWLAYLMSGGAGTAYMTTRWVRGFYDGTVWTEQIKGANLINDQTLALSSAAWSVAKLTINQDRIAVPEEATHIQLEFNLDSLNNAGGYFALDDTYFTPF